MKTIAINLLWLLLAIFAGGSIMIGIGFYGNLALRRYRAFRDRVPIDVKLKWRKVEGVDISRVSIDLVEDGQKVAHVQGSAGWITGPDKRDIDRRRRIIETFAGGSKIKW